MRGRPARLLVLDRAIDRDEHLALADPVALIGGDGNNPAAFARDPHGDFAPGRDRSGGGDRAFHRSPPWRDHGDHRQLRIGIGRGRCVTPTENEIGDGGGKQDQQGGDDPGAARAWGGYRRTERPGSGFAAVRGHGRFVIHGHCRPGCKTARPRGLQCHPIQRLDAVAARRRESNRSLDGRPIAPDEGHCAARTKKGGSQAALPELSLASR